MNRHFCCNDCRKNGDPCDLCLAQRRKILDDQLRADAKPTLTHQPFAKLLKP